MSRSIETSTRATFLVSIRSATAATGLLSASKISIETRALSGSSAPRQRRGQQYVTERSTTEAVNTFNKVWIIPEKALVYENAKAGTAYVVESKLKVMLEQDYLSLQKHEGTTAPIQGQETNQLGSQIVREIVIPLLTREVNEGKNFSQLRQIYNSLILATWYKKKIKEGILEQVYTNKNKVVGVTIDDPNEKQRIYERYLQAFKKGAYSYIKEEFDPATQETMPRKYFSGGMSMIVSRIDFVQAHVCQHLWV